MASKIRNTSPKAKTVTDSIEIKASKKTTDSQLELLQNELSKFKELFNKSEECSFTVNLSDFTIEHCNRRFLLFTGFSENDIIGKPIDSFVHGTYSKKFHTALANSVSGKNSNGNNSIKILDKQGKSKIVKLTIDVLAGSSTCLCSVREQLNHTRGYGNESNPKDSDIIFNSNPNPIWYKDTLNNYISVNNSAARLIGLDKAEIEGKNASLLFPAKHLQYYKEDLQVINSGKPLYGIVESFQNYLGDLVWLITDKIPILDDKGKVSRIAVFATDITDKRANEERIVSVSEELELIFESIPATLWYKDTHNNFIRVNQKAADLIGLEKNQIEGHNSSEIFPLESEKFYTDDLEVMNSGLPKYNIIEHLTAKDGSIRWMQTDKIPLKDKYGNTSGLLVIAVDITQWRITEEALDQSESRFSEFADMLPLTVFETDLQGNITYCNSKGFSEFGFDTEVIQSGISISDLIFPLRSESSFEFFMKRFSEPGNKSSEFVFQRSDGSIFPGIVFTNVIEKKYKIIGLRGVLLNIENLKKTEEALNRSEELMRNIFEKSAIGMTISYLGGRFHRVNQAFCSMTMYSEDELLAMNSDNITYLDDIESTSVAIENLIKGKFDYFKLEKRYIRSDGRTIWVNVTMTLVRSESLQPLYIISQIEDITEQKQTAMALRESEEKYRNLTSSLPVGVYRTTPQGKILFANDTVAKMLGYESANDLYYIDVFDTYAHRNDRFDYLNRFSLTSGDVAQEIRIMSKSGKELWLSDQGHPVFDNAGELMYIDGILENITEKRLSEQVLRDSESRFRMLFEKAPLAYQSLDKYGNFIDVNAAWLELLGYNSDDIIGHHFTEFLREDEKSKFHTSFKNFLETGEISNIELVMRKKDGTNILVSFNGKVGRDANGVFKQTHSILNDITQSKLLETQIISLKEFYETIVEKVNDGIMVFDKDDNFTYVNTALERLAESGRDELIGNNFKAVFHRYLESEFINIFDEVKKTFIPTYYDEEFYIKRTDNLAFYNGWLIPLTEGQNYSGMIVTMQDISDRKQQETNLDKRNRILQAVTLAAELLMKSADFDKSINNVLRLLGEATNSDRVFIYKHSSHSSNDEFHLCYEWIRSGFASRNASVKPSDTVTKRHRFSQFLRHYEDEPTVYGTINEFPKQFQILFDEKGVKSILTNEIRIRGELWGYIGFDDCSKERLWTDAEIDSIRTASFIIDGALERREVIEALQVGEKQLREAIKAKDKFLNIIAHDLRGPFSGFIGLAEILTKDIHEMSLNEITKITTEMHRTSLRLFALLENLLEWSRTQTGRFDFNPQMADLHYIILNKFNLYQISAAKKHIRLVSEIQPDTYLCADIHMLKTILRNLLNNAIKFIPEDESKDNTITVSARESGEFLEISVSDTGIGISEEDIGKLFRIDVSHISINNSTEKGTGLGLILCKEFTSLHGGAIECESTSGIGTTFRFTLPRDHEFYRKEKNN